MKVVVNRCFGGFGLSEKAVIMLQELKQDTTITTYTFSPDIQRSDPDLVKVVETLGREADGTYAELEVVTIPNDVSWHISEYDGAEHIAEDHRTW